MEKITFYNIRKTIEAYPEAKYYMVYGERSNGKTFSALEYALDEYLANDSQFAIIRRYIEDFRGGNALRFFNGFIENEFRGNIIEKKTKGEYNNVYYISGTWYLEHLNEKGERDKIDSQPFAYRFALSRSERDKGTSYPKIRNIIFDEFLTRDGYLDNEFIDFQNVISTIARTRDDIKIFMLGNSVNKYSPYFHEMGLTRIKNMKKGTIDVYKYGDSSLEVVVEYSDFPSKKKKSDKLFAFDNPRLKMITKGDWEIDIYPHLPYKYEPKDILYTYFIDFDEEILQGEIIYKKGEYPINYIHRKTTPIKEGLNIVYSLKYSHLPNWSRHIDKPKNEMEKKIYRFFATEKTFYQDNEVGDVVMNFLNASKSQ